MKTTRRQVLTGITAGTMAATLPQTHPAFAAETKASGQRDKLDTLLAEAMIIDDLAGFKLDASAPDESFRILKDSAVTIISPTLGSSAAEESFQSCLEDLAQLSATISSHPDRLLLVSNFSDVDRAKRESKLGILVNFQNSTAIGSDLSKLDLFYNLGVRQIQLTYNRRNWVGDGCLERTQAGLSYFGVDLIEKMNKLGIIVDASHCGYMTTMDAIEASSKPIVFSHTNCMALTEHPRNKTDEQIKALADKGGVIGISAFNWFVSHKQNVTLKDLLDHFDYAVNLVGADHVGIGTDFGFPGYPGVEGDAFWIESTRSFSPHERDAMKLRWPPYIEEVNDEWRYRTIAQGLLKRGHSEEVVRKILGLNLRRVFKDVLRA